MENGNVNGISGESFQTIISTEELMSLLYMMLVRGHKGKRKRGRVIAMNKGKLQWKLFVSQNKMGRQERVCW